MNNTSVDPLVLQTSEHLHAALFKFRGFHIAGLCVLVYDFLLTLDLELAFFWPVHPAKAFFEFSALRLLFLLNRYLPILTQLFLVIGITYSHVTDRFCTIMIKDIVSVALVVQWFAIPGAVACYRTCALYKGERRMVVGILTAYLASVVCSAFVVGFAVKHSAASAAVDPSDTLKICHAILPDKSMYAAFVAPVVFVVGVSFAAMHAILRHRESSHAAEGSRLMSELAKGTIAWLLVVASVDVINLCVFAFVQTQMRHVFDGIMFALVSIASNRQLLHLREIGAERDADITTSQSGTLPVNFRHRTSQSKSYNSASPSFPRSPMTPSFPRSPPRSPMGKSFGEKVGLSSMFSQRTLVQDDAGDVSNRSSAPELEFDSNAVPLSPLPHRKLKSADLGTSFGR